ncbi:Calcium/calmodulin-dependent protein kinase type IV [Phytophthora ramorum]|uniref:Calcium/calmodulin-dependent protein kinase type IV n=1 Tax=Phytophthora ramorum TaxID=164328 RepID=UPI0030B355D7|nr:Calcium/calmodulin-dependent protein kinase type IV [Phytophthora ramorum]
MGVCSSRRWPSLAEFYELESPEVVLGEGSCSRVFRARERASGGLVAIKRLDKAHQRLIDDDPVQWQREVALLRRCASHPNVVALHDVLETPEFVYIVMELAEGGELFQALIDEGAYSEWDARRFITDLLEALRFLHDLGIAHGDVKPENLLLTSASSKLASIKLADFGLAALVEESSLLYNGRMTWAYCAPEVLKTAPSPESDRTAVSRSARSSGVGLKSDLWSVGIVLHVLLSGIHPFDPDGRQTRDQMIRNIQSGRFSMTGPRWDAVSSEAKGLISALLQPSPEERPTTAKALSHEWFGSSRTSRESLAVSISDTEGLKQYRHLMRRKFRTSVIAAVAAETLRRSLRKSRQSTGSVAGEDACDIATGSRDSMKVEEDADSLAAGVASPCPSSSESVSAAVVGSTSETNDEHHFAPTHSVLKHILQLNSQKMNDATVEVTTSIATAAEVDDIEVNV